MRLNLSPMPTQGTLQEGGINVIRCACRAWKAAPQQKNKQRVKLGINLPLTPGSAVGGSQRTLLLSLVRQHADSFYFIGRLSRIGAVQACLDLFCRLLSLPFRLVRTIYRLFFMVFRHGRLGENLCVVVS